MSFFKKWMYWEQRLSDLFSEERKSEQEKESKVEKDSLGQNRLRFHSTLECTCLKDAKQCKSKIFVKHEQLKTPFLSFLFHSTVEN